MHANTCDTAGKTPAVSQLISLLTTLNLHAGDICRGDSLLRGGQRSLQRAKAHVEALLAARGDRPAKGPARHPYGRCWPEAGQGGSCALPCAPCARWLLHLVTVRSGAARGHMETSCVACTNVSRRRVSAFGGVLFTLCVQPVGPLTADARRIVVDFVILILVISYGALGLASSDCTSTSSTTILSCR